METTPTTARPLRCQTGHVHRGPTPPADTADRRYAPIENGTEGRCACGTWVRATVGDAGHVSWAPVVEVPFDPATEV